MGRKAAAVGKKVAKMESKISEIVERHGRQQRAVVAMMQDVEGEFKYLPREALEKLSEMIDVPMTQLFSLATFYTAFSLKPRGKHPIDVCLGTACHVRGGQLILETFERDLGIKAGSTTGDLNFSLNRVNCMGCCAIAPVVTIGEDLHSKVSMTKVPALLKRYTKQS